MTARIKEGFVRARKQKPHFDVCPLCDRIYGETNFPTKKSPKIYTNWLCMQCITLVVEGIKNWRLKHAK